MALKDPSTILALPFEDADLATELRSMYPGAEIEVLKKQDIAGLPVSALLKRIRKDRKDLVVGSLKDSTANRTTAMMELILGLSRSGSRLLRERDGSFRRLHTSHMIFGVLPILLIGTITGFAIYALTSVIVVYARLVSHDRSKILEPNDGRKTVLFLRTDLAGGLQAGGSVSHVKGIIKGFIASGYDVVFIADEISPALPQEVKQISIKPMKFLDFFDEFQLLAFNLQLCMKAGRLARSLRPALVYQRMSIFNFAGGFIAREAGVPMVLEANASEVWAKKNWSRLLFERLATQCESTALRMADEVTMVSDVVREQLAKYNLPEEKLLTVPNGVDPDEFSPSIDGTPVRVRYNLGNATVVGFIGTFTKWHGVETLCDAAITALERNKNLRFLMIGDGELRAAIQKRTVEEGFGEYFVFTGTIPHRDAPAHLAACDILVSPHLGFSDGTKFFGSPTKLFEYMAMGKPIIASRLEQIGEIIKDGVNGFLMTPGDRAGLAERILDLATNPTAGAGVKVLARKDCVENHTQNANVRKILRRFYPLAA